MATQSGRERSATQRAASSSEQAAEGSAGFDSARARLAQRSLTPRWYHPLVGGILAIIVTSSALLPLEYSFPVIAAGVVAMVPLARLYTRRYQVPVTGVVGPRTRRLQNVVRALVGAGFLSSLILVIVDVSTGWVLIPGVAVFGGVIVLGRRYDEALRSEMARRHGERRSARGSGM